jgi:hypothetical protein
MNKINIWRIVRDHFGTLRNFQTGEVSGSDILTFFALPFFAALTGAYRHAVLSGDVLIAILTAFSIFAGLLFSLLLLVFSLTDKSDPQSMLFATRKQLVAELYDNISFAILTSIAIVTLTIIAGMKTRENTAQYHAEWVLTSVLILLMTNFILTILMILKRMHALLTQALKEKSAKKIA